MTDTSAARDETAADLFRDDYDVALARGDMDAARKADALERQALGGELAEFDEGEVPEDDAAEPSDIQAHDIVDLAAWGDYQPWDALTETEQSDEHDRLYEQADPDTAERTLRAEWPGKEYERNLQFVKGLFASVSGSAQLLRVLEATGFADHPALIRWAASVGRMVAEVSGDPTTIRLFPGTGDGEDRNMSDTGDDNFDEETDLLMTQQEQAQVEGNLATVDRIEKELRARFVKRYGTGAAVGSSGGPTA